MKKINFKQFKFYTDITKQHTVDQDVSMSFADAIYKQANGILAHDLAFRIYRSTEAIELSEEEVNFLRSFVATTTPLFQDSFEMNLE